MKPTHRHDGLLISLGQAPPALVGPLVEAWHRGEVGISREAGALWLSLGRLWALDDAALAALGQRRYVEGLRVRERGRLGGPGYAWSLLWSGHTGAVEGGWLRRDADPGPPWLLSPALHAAVALAAGIPSNNKTQIFRALIQLQRLAADCPALELPPRLAKKTVYDVNRVQCEVEGPDEAPQLSARLRCAPPPPEVPLVHAEATGDGYEASTEGAWDRGLAPAEVSETDELIVPLDLTGAVQSPQQLISDAAWELDDTVVLLPAAVSRDLFLIQLAAEQPPALRRSFAQNPLAYLPDAEAFDEAHYSERVIGLRFAPSAATAPSNSPKRWGDPLDGLLIEAEDGDLWVAGEALSALANEARAALDEGRPALRWEGRNLPLSPGLCDALERATAERAKRPADAKAPDRPLILAIRENEASLEWAPRAPRRAAPLHMESPLQPGLALKPHQREALDALRRLWRRGEPGALLCDDMGLGKTLQGAIFAAWVAAQLRAGGGAPEAERVHVPVMIVAPPALLHTWLVELEARLPPEHLRRLVWGPSEPPPHSPGRELVGLSRFRADTGRSQGHAVLETARLDLVAWSAFAPDLLLISYEGVRSLQHAVGQLRVGLLIADEAQQVKNPTALRSIALRAMNVDFSIALTGTPIENAWLDLWTICDRAIPGVLGTRQQFVRDYPQNEDLAAVGARLQARLQTHLIRRTREATLGDTLPSCAVVADRRPMPSEQALAYRAELARHGYNEGADVLALLQGLARVSLHPRPRTALNSADEARAWMLQSARTHGLLDALETWAPEGEAVLIFVESRAVQATLRAALEQLYALRDVPILNGEESQAARAAGVDRVRKGRGFRVLIVSPKVGGAGWNLQFAARSALLERPYNPAVEAQMIGRTWRIGQMHPVEVRTPQALLEGTVSYDEVLDELLTEKRSLAASVLSPSAIREDEVRARFASRLRSAPTA